MDMGWSTNPTESFRLFQGKVLEEYDRIVEEFDLSVIDATGSITEQQRAFRRLVASYLGVPASDEEPIEGVEAVGAADTGGHS
jgi:dTMP kinase